MAKNLFIAAADADSGKSLVSLGIMEMLSRQLKRVGFFRPIIQSSTEKDHDIVLISERYNLPLNYPEMYGSNTGEALELLQSGGIDALFAVILNKYKKLEQQCDFVLCEGTDYTGSLKPFEFDFNARLANNLGSPILGVVNGSNKTVGEIADTVQIIKTILAREKCTFMGMVVNRANPAHLREIENILKKYTSEEEIGFVIPEKELLQMLTMRQIGTSLQARLLYGDEDILNNDVLDFKVGAMSLEHILSFVREGILVVTPADRSDVIIGLIMTLIAENYPKIVGILLTGGNLMHTEIAKLLKGVPRLPASIYSIETDTFTTTTNLSRLRPVLIASNERRIAAALGLFESSVDIQTLKEKIAVTRSEIITPAMFEYELFERAASEIKHIVLPEGTDERILRATEILLRRNVVEITLLGNEEEILKKAANLHIGLNGANIIDPYDNDLVNEYAAEYFRLRKHKGATKEAAFDLMHDVSYLGTMMVHKGHADGMVSGAAHTTQHTIRPAFEFIKTKPGFKIVSSSFFMCFEDRVLVYADCAVNPNPNSEELADIAISSADTARLFGIEPRIAMLSYSTGDSGKGADVEKVRQATAIVKNRRPDLNVEGPIQYDAAIDATVANLKLPGSTVAGKATVFIFPDLNTGNNTYKAVQRAANAVAIGPVLQGLNKPVNDLSRGCLVKDIVNTVVITAIQAQQR